MSISSLVFRLVRSGLRIGRGASSCGTKTLACSRSIGFGPRLSEKPMKKETLASRLQKTPCVSGSKATEKSACGRSSEMPNGPLSTNEAATSPVCAKVGRSSV